MRSLGFPRGLMAFVTPFIGWIWLCLPSHGRADARCDDTPAAATTAIDVREGLAISGLSRNRRALVAIDPVAARVVAGTWTMPRAGDLVANAEGQPLRWELIQAGNDGTFSHSAPNGYLAATITMSNEGVMVLEASGNMMVYVNGEPRVGDNYATGYGQIPVWLHKGPNLFLFQTAGRIFKARLTTPKALVFLNTADLTAPDLVANQPVSTQAAIVVVNATTSSRTDLAIAATAGDGALTRVSIPVLAPLSVRKVAFEIQGTAPRDKETCPLQLKLERKVADSGETWEPVDTASITLRVRQPGQTQKQTFRSEIDGSVQYYAVVPALRAPSQTSQGRPGLVLTLHGAAVEAIGQAEAYSPKPGLHIVAPTNRRPYGFDWEDWGRLDAIEVLEYAQRVFDTDRRRTYLTGHSMGGHGAWHLGVTFPDRFAAIRPAPAGSACGRMRELDESSRSTPSKTSLPARQLQAILWRSCIISAGLGFTSCMAMQTTTSP